MRKTVRMEYITSDADRTTDKQPPHYITNDSCPIDTIKQLYISTSHIFVLDHYPVMYYYIYYVWMHHKPAIITLIHNNHKYSTVEHIW